MSEELQLGRYVVTINTGERRCGIHGNNTESGRCWECDGRRDPVSVAEEQAEARARGLSVRELRERI